MSVEAQLRAEVRSRPDDDQPRLVYADWLADQGDADRATFIRLQIERAQLPDDAPEAISLELKERVLRARGETRWRAALPGSQHPELYRWGSFRRGFVQRVGVIHPSDFAPAHEMLVNDSCVEGVALPWRPVGSVPPLPANDHLRELTIHGQLLSADMLTWLTASPLLRSVRRLALVDTDLDEHAFRRLLDSAYLGDLDTLAVSWHSLKVAGVQALIDRFPDGLVELDLSLPTADELGSGGRYMPTMGALGAQLLAAWPGLSRVRTLDLSGQQIETAGLAALLSSPFVNNLERLRIRAISDWDWESGVRPDVLTAFVQANPDLALRELELAEVELTGAGARALAESPALRHLATFRIDYVNGEPDALAHLAAAPWMRKLRRLRLSDVPTRGAWFDDLIRQGLPEVADLALVSHFGWSEHPSLVATLLEADLPNVRALQVLDRGAEADGWESLGEAENLPALEALKLSDERDLYYFRTDIDNDEAARRFLDSPLGKRCTSVTFRETAVAKLPPPTPILLPQGIGHHRHYPWRM